MSHYAKVENGIVTQVIVAEPEFFDTFVDTTPGEWIKTSYNIKGGVYYDPETNQPAEDQSVIEEDEARQRKNYAGISFSYDQTKDAFIPPQPYSSWVLNNTTCLWDAPIACPDDGNRYQWNEETTSWDQVTKS
tara:strand:- start:39 stop:437 length:399 start_codon:yes stop_codon:yes gene_type:complete